MDSRRSASTRRARTSRATIVAVALVVLGVWFWVLYGLTINGERHSYGADATPASTVALVDGRTYHLAVHDGVRELTRLGLTPQTVRCDYRLRASGESGSLDLTPEADDTKAVDQIATFVAPVSGRLHITCTGISAVFVDDAPDAGFDRAGLFLVLGCILLTVGLPLGLSVLRGRVRVVASGEDEKVE